MRSPVNGSCLVSIYGTGQVLGALAAVAFDEQRNGLYDRDEMTILVHPPLGNRDAVASARTVARLVSSAGWPTPVSIPVDAGRRFPKPRIAQLRQRFGYRAIKDIYYSHALTGAATSTVIAAFPDARRTVYGDALGTVFRSNPHDAPHPPGDGPANNDDPHRATLILPVDRSQGLLDEIEMQVVPRSLVLEAVTKCREAVPELDDYVSQLRPEAQQPRYLLVLSNLPESGVCTLEAATDLYEMAVRNAAPPGALIVIKGHPLSSPSLIERLLSRLQHDFKLSVIPDALRFYPLEMWPGLVEGFEVIPGVSYSAVAVAYLYEAVCMPVSDVLIDRFIGEPYRRHFKTSMQAYREIITRLSTWDGESIIWREQRG